MSTLIRPRGRAVRASAVLNAFFVAAACGLIAASARLVAQEPPSSPPTATRPAAAPLTADRSPGFTETPAERDARMAWFREARFGLFIHWGVYSELAGRYDGKAASGTGEWIFQNAKPPMSKYEETARRFNPVNYDPVAWANLAKEAGMKYVVITSKHHDGFCLWDSALTDWDVSRTPQGKDLLEPLAAACKEAGLRLGLYFTIMDWHHADYAPRRAWNDLHSAHGPPVFERFVPYVHGQMEEIVRRYDPALLWFDGEWENTWTVEHGAALEAKLRALKPSIIMNNRVGKSRNDMAGLDRPDVKKAGDYGTPEQEVPARGLPGVDWETCMTMNDTWGYRLDDARWKPAGTLVRTLVDVASKGGNFLLNVGPTGTGEIPPESIARLKAIGAWMSVNGEAIYGTDASPFERLPFGRATRKGDRTLYLHVFERPAGGVLKIPGLKSAPQRASVLGDSAAALKSKITTDGVVVSIGGTGAADRDVTVIKLEFAAPFVVDPTAALPRPLADGTLKLGTDDAVVHDGTLCTERFPTGDKSPSLGCWTNPKTWVTFDAILPAAGRYRVSLDYACAPTSAGSEVAFELDGERVGLPATTSSTGAWSEFGVLDLGTVELRPGRRSFGLRALQKRGDGVMNLRGLRLVAVP